MNRFAQLAAGSVAALLISVSASAQISYSEDFEGLDAAAGDALSASGWKAFAAVFNDFPGCSNFLYVYGDPFPAPNGGPGFSSLITVGATGQALNTYTDYNNREAQEGGQCVETSVFQETTVALADVGSYVFSFDIQAPTEPADSDVLGAGVSTFGFIKLLDPNNGFNVDVFLFVDTATAGAKSIEFALDASADGKILQWGFTTKASNDLTTGRWYDNLALGLEVVEPPPVVPPPVRPPVTEESIPTLGTWGLALMILLLGGLGFRAFARR